MIVTAAAMALVSLVTGWEKRGELLHEEKEGWLRTSQLEVRKLAQARATPGVRQGAFVSVLPALLAIVVVVIGLILSFVVFW